MKRRNYKHIIFDLDSTLVKIEGLDELARRKGKYSKVAKLTQLSMEGKIDFGYAMIKKMKIISPNRKDLEWLGNFYIKNLVYGVKKLVGSLKDLGKEVYMITGNFGPAVLPLASCLGIKGKNVFCNEIYFDAKGKYRGFGSDNLLSKNGGKAELIKGKKFKGGCILVGDGSTDLEAKSSVDLFVGYGGVKQRKNVEDGADIFVKSKNINLLHLAIFGEC